MSLPAVFNAVLLSMLFFLIFGILGNVSISAPSASAVWDTAPGGTHAPWKGQYMGCSVDAEGTAGTCRTGRIPRRLQAVLSL